MSGLADYEKHGLFDLFKNQEDKTILIQLAKSLTKNYMPAETLEDALNIVFLHGGSAATILNKKILTKEILFKYLHRNSVRVASDFTKIALVEQTQNFWKEKFSGIETNDVKNIKQPRIKSIEGSQNNYVDTGVVQQQTNQIAVDQRQNYQGLSSVIQQQTNQIEVDQRQNYQGLSRTDSTSYPINLLANKFSEWFFKSYNEEILKSDDFWIDTTLNLRMIEKNSENVEEHIGSSSIETTEILLGIKKKYNFYFNPNLTYEGVQGRQDVHGLVLVLCCGTIHIVDRCIGTFESIFGLIRDPNSENNWKIKHMKFILKSSAIMQQLPSLSNSETLSEILSLPEPSGNI